MMEIEDLPKFEDGDIYYLCIVLLSIGNTINNSLIRIESELEVIRENSFEYKK